MTIALYSSENEALRIVRVKKSVGDKTKQGKGRRCD